MLFVQKQDIVVRNIEGLFFLVDITKKDYANNSFIMCINEMGKFIWDNLRQTSTIEQITESIIDFSIDEELEYDEVYNDIKDFIHQLKSEGLIICVEN
jgi:hypothetical protein